MSQESFQSKKDKRRANFEKGSKTGVFLAAETFHQEPVKEQEPEKKPMSFIEKLQFKPAKVTPLDKPQLTKQDEFEYKGDNELVQKSLPPSND